MTALQSFTETRNNKEHIHAYDGGDCRILEVETSKLRVRGRRWDELSSFEKRKFENLLFLDEPHIITKVRYV